MYQMTNYEYLYGFIDSASANQSISEDNRKNIIESVSNRLNNLTLEQASSYFIK